MARRGAGADLRPYGLFQRLVQHLAGRKAHEQHNAHVVVPVLPDTQCLGDLLELLDLIVDLRRPPMRTPPGFSVASERPWMTMPSWLVHSAKSPWHQIFIEPFEIGGAVFRAVRIVPEHHRHGGEAFRADQFALLAAHRRPSSSPDVHGKAKARPLDLAAP